MEENAKSCVTCGMMPQDFAEANYKQAVHERFKNDCIPVMGMRNIDKEGNPYILMKFQPNKEDIEAILAGRPICVNFYSHELKHPITVYTYDEENKING